MKTSKRSTRGNAVQQTGRVNKTGYSAYDPADISPDPLPDIYDNSNPPAKPKKKWLALELIILLALCLKLLGTAGFILIHEKEEPVALDAKVLATPVAHAQEEQPTTMLPQDASLTQQYQRMIQDLQVREEAVKKREERLNEREKALDILEKQINERLTEIEATRDKLSMLVKRHEELVQEQKILKDARIEHLVAAYKGMRPEAAGNLMNNLEDDVAVEILASMPGRNAGQILANVNPEKAARLTKAISERKPQPEPGKGGARLPRTK